MKKSALSTPDWVPDAVFYQIFPDRFARSGRVTGLTNLEPWDSPPTPHGFKGGDLWGVLDKLDYLQDLGVNALYLCPVFQSTANHRYHTHDYYRVDPVLGGDAALRALLDAAHERGMHVILDGVFNHASRGFFQFNHILENGPASPYLDWFIIRGFPLRAYSRKKPPNYACWWDLRALPKFNTANPAVRQFIYDVARYWIEFGADGWRLDVPNEIDDDKFWQEFRRVVKKTNPQAYIVGEIWGEGHRWLQGDQFDAIMNYVWARTALGFALGRKPPKKLRHPDHPIKPLDANQFAAAMERLVSLHPQKITHAQLNLLGSHDTPRLLSLARGDTARVRLAFLLQMTAPGAPCIYYGDEVGLTGGHDPDCRAAFPWDESRWDHALRDHVRQLIGLRHALPPLRRGDWVHMHISRKQNTYVFARRYQGETALVALNAGSRPFEHWLLAGKTGWPDGTRLVDRLGGGRAEVRDQRIVGLHVPPLSGAIVTPETA